MPSRANGADRRGDARRTTPHPRRRRAAVADDPTGLLAIQLELARRRGRELTRHLGRLAAAPAGGLRASAVVLRSGIERRLGERLALALDRIGIPTQQSLAALEARIAEVGGRIDELEKRGRTAPRRGRTRSARPA